MLSQLRRAEAAGGASTSMDGLDLAMWDELHTNDSPTAHVPAIESAPSMMVAPEPTQMFMPPLPPRAIHMPYTSLQLPSIVPLSDEQRLASAEWKLCYAKVHVRVNESAALVTHAHVVLKADISFRGECTLRVTRTTPCDDGVGDVQTDKNEMHFRALSGVPGAVKDTEKAGEADSEASTGSGKGKYATAAEIEQPSNNGGALRSALLSELRLAEQLQRMTGEVARAVSVLISTTSVQAAREALQQFSCNENDRTEVRSHSSLFVWMVHDASSATHTRNYTAIWDARVQPGLNTASNATAFQPAVLSALQRFAEVCFPQGGAAAASSHTCAAAAQGRESEAPPSHSVSYEWPLGHNMRGACARHIAQVQPLITRWGRCFVGSSINCEDDEGRRSDYLNQPSAHDYHADQIISYTREAEKYTEAVVATFVRAPTLLAAQSALSKFDRQAQNVCCDVFVWRILENQNNGQHTLSAVYHPLYREPENEIGVSCYVWPTLQPIVRAALKKFVQIATKHAIVKRVSQCAYA